MPINRDFFVNKLVISGFKMTSKWEINKICFFQSGAVNFTALFAWVMSIVLSSYDIVLINCVNAIKMDLFNLLRYTVSANPLFDFDEFPWNYS